jgi:hypothetical protein
MDWPGSVRVTIGTLLKWQVRLTQSLPSRIMNAAAQLVPDAWWQERFMLKAMGTAARIVLGSGDLNLGGRTPNNYEFIANPQRIWLIESSHAILNRLDLGPTGPLVQQAHLGEFLIPQKGNFRSGPRVHANLASGNRACARQLELGDQKAVRFPLALTQSS